MSGKCLYAPRDKEDLLLKAFTIHPPRDYIILYFDSYFLSFKINFNEKKLSYGCGFYNVLFFLAMTSVPYVPCN